MIIKGSGDRRNHECNPTVDKSPCRNHLEQRDHDSNERQHHGQQQNAHQDVFALVMINFKAITGNGTNQQCKKRKQNRVAERVRHGEPQVLIRN